MQKNNSCDVTNTFSQEGENILCLFNINNDSACTHFNKSYYWQVKYFTYLQQIKIITGRRENRLDDLQRMNF